MKPEYMLAIAIVALLVLAFVAYQVKGRLSGFTIKHGDTEASITANAGTPGVTATDVSAKHNATIVDQTGAGVVATRISADGDATIRNEAPRKNG